MINTSINRVTYKGDGENTVFPISFPFLDKEDVVVAYVNKDNDTITLTKDYFIDITAKTVIYPGYPPGEERSEAEQPPKLQTGERLLIYRNIDINQESSLGDVWPFNVIEDSLDKLTMIAQDLKANEERFIKIPESADTESYTMEFPYPKEGNVIVWKDGKLVNEDYRNAISKYIAEADTYAKAAKDSAVDAEANARAAKETLSIAEEKKKEFQDFAMAIMDSSESELKECTDKLLAKLDNYTENSKSELLELVKSAKHYADIAKAAAEFDPETYYTKEETDQTIREAISAIADYDEKTF